MVLALGTSLFFVLRNTARPVDLAALSRVVPLRDGVRDGPSLVARLADPGWDQRPREEQERLAGRLFEEALAMGVRSLTLLDGNGRQRVIVAETTTGRLVLVQ
jgi:hypothetical protein